MMAWPKLSVQNQEIRNACSLDKKHLGFYESAAWREGPIAARSENVIASLRKRRGDLTKSRGDGHDIFDVSP
jgi:hypothetical protein